MVGQSANAPFLVDSCSAQVSADEGSQVKR